MNDENLAILIENIIRAVRSCAEPFFVPVTNETEYTEHAKRTPQASRPAPRTNDDTSPYTYGYVELKAGTKLYVNVGNTRCKMVCSSYLFRT